MVILNEKMAFPPPPYAPATARQYGESQRHPGVYAYNITMLPPQVLLHVVYMLLSPVNLGRPDMLEYQRRVMYWICTSLRRVNRSFYVACMHILRSTYLPAYTGLVRPPYTSDPFPLSSADSSPSNSAVQPSRSASSSSSSLASVLTLSNTRVSSSLPSIISLQRETKVLDMYIALRVREDVMVDESGLHMTSPEAIHDLFDHAQPRARLEDLVRKYGMREGVVSISSSSPPLASSSRHRPSATALPAPSYTSHAPYYPSPSAAPPSYSSARLPASPPTSQPQPPSCTRQPSRKRVAFASLAINFSPRSVGLVLFADGRKRTVVQVPRERQERLESTAKRLVKDLIEWLADS